MTGYGLDKVIGAEVGETVDAWIEGAMIAAQTSAVSKLPAANNVALHVLVKVGM